MAFSRYPITQYEIPEHVNSDIRDYLRSGKEGEFEYFEGAAIHGKILVDGVPSEYEPFNISCACSFFMHDKGEVVLTHFNNRDFKEVIDIIIKQYYYYAFTINETTEVIFQSFDIGYLFFVSSKKVNKKYLLAFPKDIDEIKYFIQEYFKYLIKPALDDSGYEISELKCSVLKA